MRVSFIATVFNEEKTIVGFLKSIFFQSIMPDEIIIVDGGSSDRTVDKIRNSNIEIRNKRIKFKLLVKKGNRSIGRNEAINQATSEIIVCSDAGCILDKDWIKNIIKPFEDKSVDVVAGYYKGKPKNIFQKCLIPYVLVMEDRINPNDFLPATRSMAFRRKIWKKAGGFPEQFSNNEDYVFAKRLKKLKANILFEKKAIAYWIPRKNFKEAFIMFFRFALGDAQASFIRPKVVILFARYILSMYLLFIAFLFKSGVLLLVVSLLFVVYICWSIWKNYKYVKRLKGGIILPVMQLISDLAVISGTSIGFFKKANYKKISQIIIHNKEAVLIIGLYAICMLLLLNWGVPNENHPFSYFMDEWHQAQAVRTVFTEGSPNVPGSANGSMFHFVISGIWLLIFTLLGILNPFSIQSSVDSLEMQKRLFEVLRLNTLMFGILSVILIAYIAKKYFNLNTLLIVFLFVINPIWLTLSNYFKYDIAFIFWITLSFLLFLRYSTKSSFINYSLAALVSGLAVSVKLSALPLLPILFISYFIFAEKRRYNMWHLATGIFIFFLTVLIFGIPDLLLGKGDIREYLYDNLVRAPNYTFNYILGTNYIFYLVFKSTSTVFGNVLFFLSSIALIFTGVYLLRCDFQKNINKRYLFIVISLFVFIASLSFLKTEARGNRLLVLLPFMVLLSVIFISKVLKLTSYLKKTVIFALTILLSLQAIESFSWVNLKLKADLRESSSDWIINNIPQRSTIGIENIPIYQFLPDVLLKNFYLSDRSAFEYPLYNYKVIDDSFTKLPVYVVVSNEQIAKNYIVKSSKKDLIRFLEKKNYKKIFYEKQKSALFTLFRSELDYFMSGLIQSPTSISIYKKSN